MTAAPSAAPPRSLAWCIIRALLVAIVAIAAVPIALVMLVASLTGDRR